MTTFSEGGPLAEGPGLSTRDFGGSCVSEDTRRALQNSQWNNKRQMLTYLFEGPAAVAL